MLAQGAIYVRVARGAPLLQHHEVKGLAEDVLIRGVAVGAVAQCGCGRRVAEEHYNKHGVVSYKEPQLLRTAGVDEERADHVGESPDEAPSDTILGLRLGRCDLEPDVRSARTSRKAWPRNSAPESAWTV
jgi:hypothetical protein